MLSACLEYEDILSDKLRGAHPSPFFDKRSDFVDYPSKARLPVAFPKGREPDTHPLTKGGGQGTSTYTFRRICYPPEQKGAMYQGRAIPLPWGGPGWALRIKNPDIQLRRITYPPELLLAPNRRYPPSLGEGPGVGVSYAPNGALICQPRATPGGRGCSRDNAPEGGKRIRSHTKGCGKGKLLFILLPLRGDTDV